MECAALWTGCIVCESAPEPLMNRLNLIEFF
jgi:hypothetical protein